MSEPTQVRPLWSDEAIDKRLDGWFGERYKDEDREAYIRSGRDLITQYMIWMRDDYEELRQQDAASLAAANAEIARLTEWLNVSNNVANEFEAQLDATQPATQGQAIPSAEMLTVLKFAVNYLHWNGLHKGATEDWVAAIEWLNEQDAPTPPATPSEKGESNE